MKPLPIAPFTNKEAENNLKMILCQHTAAQSPTFCSRDITKATQRCNLRKRFHLFTWQSIKSWLPTDRWLSLEYISTSDIWSTWATSTSLQYGERHNNCFNQQLHLLHYQTWTHATWQLSIKKIKSFLIQAWQTCTSKESLKNSTKTSMSNGKV